MTPAHTPAHSPKPPRTVVALIASVARNGAIGKDNALLWRESEDQKRFRRLTLGSPVIMGRLTWESLPDRFRPLPGRRNIVLTRDPQWQAGGAEKAASLDTALAALADAPKAFVIGGAEVYAQALAFADELLLTEIDADLDGDSHFPAWSRADFNEVAREAHVAAGGIGYSFVTYQRQPRGEHV
jgi:dihydrofolate reductase